MHMQQSQDSHLCLLALWQTAKLRRASLCDIRAYVRMVQVLYTTADASGGLTIQEQQPPTL